MVPWAWLISLRLLFLRLEEGEYLPCCMCGVFWRFCSCAQPWLTLCNPVDCSPPGSPVHEILLARTKEWVAIYSCRGSSQPRAGSCALPHCQVGSLPLVPPGKPVRSTCADSVEQVSQLTMCLRLHWSLANLQKFGPFTLWLPLAYGICPVRSQNPVPMRPASFANTPTCGYSVRVPRLVLWHQL